MDEDALHGRGHKYSDLSTRSVQQIFAFGYFLACLLASMTDESSSMPASHSHSFFVTVDKCTTQQSALSVRGLLVRLWTMRHYEFALPGPCDWNRIMLGACFLIDRSIDRKRQRVSLRVRLSTGSFQGCQRLTYYYLHEA